MTTRLTRPKIQQILRCFRDIYAEYRCVDLYFPRSWSKECPRELRSLFREYEVTITCNMDQPRVIVSSGTRYHSISLED